MNAQEFYQWARSVHQENFRKDWSLGWYPPCRYGLVQHMVELGGLKFMQGFTTSSVPHGVTFHVVEVDGDIYGVKFSCSNGTVRWIDRKPPKSFFVKLRLYS